MGGEIKATKRKCYFTVRSLDGLCALILEGHKERPLEVVSRTDGNNALDRCADGIVSTSSVLAPAERICLLNVFVARGVSDD